MNETRRRALELSLEILTAGGTLTLDSVAREVGVTKPGLMYHFPTKEALVLAVVDHVIDGYEAELSRLLDGLPEQASPQARISAYLDWAMAGGFDQCDLAMFTDPRHRTAMTQRWTERFVGWLGLPEDLEPVDRARLLTVRLIADGAWFADASGVLPLLPDDRELVRDIARRLLEEES